ncbi:MAG: MCP four helix bundle domain-containing protein [Ignavibacteriales bacterium]|nr:MCP four helix bundle domain-containing protein [Ignavibacteriales bacterium]
MLNKLNNLKIGLRLTIGFGIPLAGLIVLTFVMLNSLSTVNYHTQEIINVEFPKTVWANNIIDNVNINARAIRNLLLTDDAVVQKQEKERIEEGGRANNSNLDSLRKNVKSERGKELLKNLEKARKEYNSSISTAIELADADKKNEAVNMLFGEVRTTQRNYFDVITGLIGYQNELVSKAGIEAEDANNSAKTNAAILGLVIVSLVIASSLMITRSIVKPVNVLNQAAQRIAGGELNVAVDSKNRDELGSLADSFNKMSSKISQMFEDLDGMPAPVMMIDTEFNITYMNKTASNLVGKDQKALIGQKCYNQFNTDHCQTQNCATHKAMQMRAQQSAETTARLNGTTIPIQYLAKPNIDKNGKVIGAMEFVVDLTKSKEQEKYLDENAHKLLKEMDKLSEGDLTVELNDLKTNDVVDKLFNGFNSVVKNIRNMITNVSEAVSAAASASTQISSSTEEMAAGAQEQSSQASEVAAGVEQMTSTILQTTKNASTAAENAKSAGATARDGGKIVEDTIEGMNRIAHVVAHAAETVQKLGSSSDQIGEIVQVIDDIADQTNLLALNAAIEAARAGEQGRGFAVVADEVRKLAERTTKATKEIAQMIKQIQNETSGAVDSMKKGNEEVGKGKVLAEQAGTALRNIIKGSDQVVDVALQVATASEEQSSVAEQISKNIESISAVTQQSASGTQQIARAAEDLNRLTEKLQQLVNQFNIGNYESAEKSHLSVRQNGKLIHV